MYRRPSKPWEQGRKQHSFLPLLSYPPPGSCPDFFGWVDQKEESNTGVLFFKHASSLSHNQGWNLSWLTLALGGSVPTVCIVYLTGLQVQLRQLHCVLQLSLSRCTYHGSEIEQTRLSPLWRTLRLTPKHAFLSVPVFSSPIYKQWLVIFGRVML